MRSWAEEPPPPWARRGALAESDGANDGPARRPLGQRNRTWVPLVILTTGLVLLLYSMQLGSMTTSGYDLQRLQAERNEWRQRNEQLQLEMAKFQSLAWIEVEAVRRLGMEKAARVTYLEMTPPAPAAEGEPPAAATAAAAPQAESRVPDLLGLWRGVLALIVPTFDTTP